MYVCARVCGGMGGKTRVFSSVTSTTGVGTTPVLSGILHKQTQKHQLKVLMVVNVKLYLK